MGGVMSSPENHTSPRIAPELRRALWHLRHSGLTGLREHLRRRRATAWARPRRWASKRRGRTLLPDWPLPTPQETGPRHDVTVGVIADEFTALALGYEWRSVPLTPTGWREQVEQTPIDLLFVESAWHGNDDAWRFQVIGSQGPSGHLRDMVTVLRDRGVPTVFWNKEDPAHYDEAIETARLFDWVFTTDEAMVEHYRRDLGHDRIGILPFAAQPAIHNPIRLLDEAGRPAPLRDVAFAGTYFAHKYPERREQMEIRGRDLLSGLPKNITISTGWTFTPGPAAATTPTSSRLPGTRTCAAASPTPRCSAPTAPTPSSSTSAPWWTAPPCFRAASLRSWPAALPW